MPRLDDDDLVICLDCLSPGQGDVFTDRGQKGMCKWCSGPTRSVSRKDFEKLRDAAQGPGRGNL